MKKKLLSIFTVICTLFCLCSCGNDRTPSKGLEFELNEDESSYTLLSYGDCKDSSVVIPEEYKGLPVTAIGSYAFKKSGVTEVIIPESVTQIAYDAFENCPKLSYNVYDGGKYLGSDENPYLILIDITENAKSIFKTHKDTKVIAECALWDASTERVALGGSVTHIGNAAFYGCGRLETVVLPDSLVSISSEVFGNCKSLTELAIPEGVAVIEDETFAFCSALTSLTLPKTVEKIGYSVISNCEVLRDIYFEGTAAEWFAIEKDEQWDAFTANYTVHCSDEDIKK
mgnify:CR=1 FL=1